MSTTTLQPSDQTYLQSIIDATSILCQATPQAMFTVKHLDSTHAFCSTYWAEQMHMPLEEIIGHIVCARAYNFNTDIKQHIIAEDQCVIHSKQPVMTLKITQSQHGLTPYYCLKSPIINPSTKSIVGILCQGFHLNSDFHNQLLLDETTSTTTNNLPQLTKREKEVVFLFVSHLSSQQIADTLSQLENKKITKSTIDSIFNDKLYQKFHVHSRPALFKTLVTMGYTTRIPKELLSIQSTMTYPITTY